MEIPAAPGATELRRLILNALSLFGAYVLPRLCTFVAAVVAARVLGVATFGVYGTAAALAVILSLVATLGMMQLLVRELARTPARAAQWIGAANVAKTGSVALMLVALLVLGAGPLAFPPEALAAALLLGVGYGVGAYAENLGAYFQGIERMGVWMQAQAVYGVVTGVLGVALAIITRDVVWFCAAPIAGQIMALAWLLIRAPAGVRGAWRAPWPLVARLLRSLVPFATAFILLSAYYKVDILLIERWRGDAEAGVYAAAYKFVDIAHALALVFAMSLYPRLSRLAGAVGEGGRAAGGRAAELLLLGAVPAAALLWIVREPLIATLFGIEYVRSTAVLAILAPALPLLAINALGTFVLAASERMAAVAGVYLSGLVVNVALNAILIPAHGAAGAAWAMFVSEAVVGGAMLVQLHRLAGAAPGPRVAGLAVVAAAAALPAVWLGTGLAAAAVYAGVVGLLYAATGAVPAAERALLWKAVRA